MLGVPVPPPLSLAPHLDALCVRQGAFEAVPVQWLPDGTAGMLLRVLDDGRCDFVVAGPRKCALFKLAPPCESSVLLVFKPGSVGRFVGVPVAELTDRIVTIEELWGDDGTRLLESLTSAAGLPTKVTLLEGALLRRAHENTEPASARLARRAARLLSEHHGRLKVDVVAARLGVTPRHLRRAFTYTVGVAPKEFARMARLMRALRAMDRGGSWALVASDAGYCDQAHLISEFRALLGLTPSELLQRAVSPFGRAPAC